MRKSRLLAAGVLMGIGGATVPQWVLLSGSKVEGESPARVAGTEPRVDPLAVVKKFHGHTDGVAAVAFSPDGKFLASGGGDRVVRVWNVATGEQVRSLEAHTATITALSYSPDGKRLLSGGADHQAVLWNTATGEIDAVLQQRFIVTGVGFLPDGEHFVTASEMELKLWKVGADDVERIMSADGFIQCISVSKNGTVATGDAAGSVIAWDPLTGGRLVRRQRKFTGPGEGKTNAVVSMWLNDEGDAILSDNDAVWTWDVKGNRISMAWPHWERSLGMDAGRLTIDACGEWLCVRDQSLAFHVVRQGKETIHQVAVSPAGDFVAVARGGAFRGNDWLAGGPQDVELLSEPAIIEAARGAEERAAGGGGILLRAETQGATTRVSTTGPFGWR